MSDKSLSNIILAVSNPFSAREALKGQPDSVNEEISQVITRKNYKALLPAAVGVFLITVIFIISDLNTNLWINQYPVSMMNISAEIIHSAASVMFFLSHLDKKVQRGDLERKHMYSSLFLVLFTLGCFLLLYPKIREGIAGLKLKSGKGVQTEYLTISLGAHIFEYLKDTIFEEELKEADKQLYMVKENGRNGLGYKNNIFRQTSQPTTEAQKPANEDFENEEDGMEDDDSDILIEDESDQTGNDIEDRTDLPVMLAVGKQKGKNNVKLSWIKYKGVTGYEVYWSYCDGKTNFKKYKTIDAGSKCTCTYTQKSKKRTYKYYVVAYKMVGDKKVYAAKSPTIHVAMNYNKQTNVKSITVNKSSITLNKNGGSFNIKTRIKLQDKRKKVLKHEAQLRYYSGNDDIASVNEKGKITAVDKGSCTVYVVANNGVWGKIKVKVK